MVTFAAYCPRVPPTPGGLRKPALDLLPLPKHLHSEPALLVGYSPHTRGGISEAPWGPGLELPQIWTLETPPVHQN